MQRFSVAIPVTILYCAEGAQAQLSTGSISGTVADQSAAVIVAAKVTAINTATGLARTALTGSNGVYLFSSLPPGNYTLRAVAPGLKEQVIEDVRLTVDQELRRH
jgi:hypothetical protein